jgi:hypothetical protein
VNRIRLGGLALVALLALLALLVATSGADAAKLKCLAPPP